MCLYSYSSEAAKTRFRKKPSTNYCAFWEIQLSLCSVQRSLGGKLWGKSEILQVSLLKFYHNQPFREETNFKRAKGIFFFEAYKFLAIRLNFQGQEIWMIRTGIALKRLCRHDSSPMPWGKLFQELILLRFRVFTSQLTCSCCQHLQLRARAFFPFFWMTVKGFNLGREGAKINYKRTIELLYPLFYFLLKYSWYFIRLVQFCISFRCMT